MSVISDLQSLQKASVEVYRSKIDLSSTTEERLVNSLSYSLSLHLIYNKMLPFQAELVGVPWNLVLSGEEYWKASAPLLAKLIDRSVGANDGAVKILSDWERESDENTRDFLDRCLDNLRENWDNAREAVEDFYEDAKDYYDEQMDRIRDGIGEI